MHARASSVIVRVIAEAEEVMRRNAPTSQSEDRGACNG